MGTEKKWLALFETAEVIELVGISSVQLNNLVEREQYGITPSIRSGGGRGSRRLFGDNDVYGIALVWWLFDAGLRTRTIQEVLNIICGGRNDANANDAARILLSKPADEGILIIRRGLKRSSKKRPQHLSLTDWAEVVQMGNSNETDSLLLIPVLDRFIALNEAMQELGPLPEDAERS